MEGKKEKKKKKEFLIQDHEHFCFGFVSQVDKKEKHLSGSEGSLTVLAHCYFELLNAIGIWWASYVKTSAHRSQTQVNWAYLCLLG